jgi:hypothetical protein
MLELNVFVYYLLAYAMGSVRKMRFNIILLAVFTTPLFLAGCGGSGGTNPYDGTWQAVYPPLSSDSTVTDTKITVCGNPPASFNITDAKGTVTITATCTTTLINPATDPPTKTDLPSVTTYAIASVSIVPSQVFGDKDILNAIVNGATFTGQCITTVACSAVSATGETFSMTR